MRAIIAHPSLVEPESHSHSAQGSSQVALGILRIERHLDLRLPRTHPQENTMTDHNRRPVLAATAIAAALALSALGGGAVLAQSAEVMPTDELAGTLEQMAEGSAADDTAAAAGFTLVTDEMGNTQLVRDPDAPSATTDGDDDDYDDDDEFEDDDGHDDHDDD
jgi:hypothetical protein